MTIVGYYWDGKQSWKIVQDERGNTTLIPDEKSSC